MREKVRLIADGWAFFCSELVTKAYKVCRILSPALASQACSNFLPCDMTQAKDRLQLVPNATLGPEKLIIVDGMFEKKK